MCEVCWCEWGFSVRVFLATIAVNDYSRNGLISSSGQSSGRAPVVSDACY